MILAIEIQITFSVRSIKIIGKPIIMKHNGTLSTIYIRIESWKFMEDLPLILTQADSSLFDNQQIIGPKIAPKGKKKPANADKWHSIAQFLSVSDNILFSSMTFKFYLKTDLFPQCCIPVILQASSGPLATSHLGWIYLSDADYSNTY